eukprot:s2588_g1.t1
MDLSLVVCAAAENRCGSASEVVGTAMVAGLLLVFVIPAWYWYIVPNAMKKESDHEMDIMREKERDTLTLKQLQSGLATASRLLREAEEALQDEQNDGALRCAEKAAAYYGRLPNDPESPGLIDCQRARFQAMAQNGERKRALKLSKEELDVCLAAKDTRGEAIMRLCIAETVLEKMGSKHRKEAIPNATKAAAPLDLGSFRAAHIFRDLEDDRLEAMSLLVMANAHLKRSTAVMDATKDSQLAIDFAKDALDLVRSLQDRRQEGLALHTISVGYLHLQEYRQAIQLCKQAIKIYEEIGARKLEAFERRVLARWHLRKDEPDQALEAAEKSLHMFRELEQSRSVTGWQVAALGVVVEAYLAGKDFDAAIEAINSEMKLFEARGCKSSQASAQDMLREALLAKGDFEAAKEAAERSVVLAKDVDRRMEAELLLQRAPLLGLAADANKAEESIREAVEIFKDLGAEKDRANALTMLAELHLAKNEDVDALKCAQDAEQGHRKVGNTRGQAMAYLSAGEVHQCCGRVQEAETAFNESLAMCREGGDRKGEADSLTALSKLYGESGQGIKAAEAADSALLLHRELGRKQWLLEALLSTARSKVAACKEHEENGSESPEIEKEVLSALDMAREAVGMSRRMNDAQSLIFCQHTEVEVLVAMNQFDEAMDVLKEAVALSQEQ